MAKCIISFPSAAMVVPDGEWEAVGRDAHAVIDQAKAAGVYVFAGGIDEHVPRRRLNACSSSFISRKRFSPSRSCAAAPQTPAAQGRDGARTIARS